MTQIKHVKNQNMCISNEIGTTYADLRYTGWCDFALVLLCTLHEKL